MTAEGVERVLSPALLIHFVNALRQEVGTDKLPLILAGVNLSPAMLEEESLAALDGAGAADLYARTQQALRLFYGRGARGILMRIGHGLWERLIDSASFVEKAELRVLRSLPAPARPRRALEVLAARLRQGGGSLSIHTLDLDLLLADHSSPSTLGQTDESPICYVTLGLIQAALGWATGRELDVEEVRCRATGQAACEFKIKIGGA
ncbi:MAG: V4R domain-containing protein [Anaerolineales bacterium]